MKNETLPIIILVLILISQVYLCYLGATLLEQNKKVEVPEESVPIEAFRQFLSEKKGRTIELYGWSIEGHKCVVLYNDHGVWGNEYIGSEQFVRMQTESGSQWFFSDMGDYSLVPGAN